MIAEQAHVLIGGIPYPCEATPCDGLPNGVEMVMLLEEVGHKGEITASEATTYFGRGTCMPVRFNGERHPVTGQRVFRRVAVGGPSAWQ